MSILSIRSWKVKVSNMTDDQKSMAMAAGFAVLAFSMWKWQHDKVLSHHGLCTILML